MMAFCYGSACLAQRLARFWRLKHMRKPRPTPMQSRRLSWWITPSQTWLAGQSPNKNPGVYSCENHQYMWKYERISRSLFFDVHVVSLRCRLHPFQMKTLNWKPCCKRLALSFTSHLLRMGSGERTEKGRGPGSNISEWDVHVPNDSFLDEIEMMSSTTSLQLAVTCHQQPATSSTSS